MIILIEVVVPVPDRPARDNDVVLGAWVTVTAQPQPQHSHSHGTATVTVTAQSQSQHSQATAQPQSQHSHSHSTVTNIKPSKTEQQKNNSKLWRYPRTVAVPGVKGLETVLFVGAAGPVGLHVQHFLEPVPGDGNRAQHRIVSAISMR